MATLIVDETADYSLVVPALSNINTITFANIGFGATATFAASQFSATAILSNVLISGSSAANQIIVNLDGTPFDASQWTFSNWTSGQDGVRFAGTYDPGGIIDDTIIGSSRDDYFDSGVGRDNLFGGLGNDTFYFDVPGAVNNHFGSIDGGGGSGDTIIASGNMDFFNRIPITGIERLVVQGNVTIQGSVFGAGGINEIVGGLGGQNLKLTIFGSDIDLSAVTFTNWINNSAALNLVGRNIIGSSQDDLIQGGGLLIGGGGNDIIFGDLSNNYPYPYPSIDTIIGGAGDDKLFGGDSQDTVDYQGAVSSLYIDLRVIVQTGTGGLGTDQITGFENITGGAFDDVLIGSNLSNVLRGGAGNDQLYGLEDIDTPGGDTLYGEAGDDYINAGDGTDTVYGGDGNDVISGGNGSDNFGTYETLYGDAGADFITGGGGHDIIYGGDGNDIWLGAGDALDYVFGGDGNDRIDGGAGDDYLTGGLGRDYLTGGAGDDQFRFNLADYQAFVIDRIGDFSVAAPGNSDSLWLQGTAADYTFSDVNGAARIEHVASHGVIYVDNFSVGQFAGSILYFV